MANYHCGNLEESGKHQDDLDGGEMKYGRITALFLTICILCFGIITLSTEKSYAVTAASWNAGRIIDDSLFIDNSSMSVDQIQSFLNSKVGTGINGVPGQCDTYGVRTSELGGGTRAQYGAAHNNPTPFTCLKDFYEVPKIEPGPGIPENNYGGKSIPSGARSAAQLIWDAAQKFNISPKVLLVKLGTESAGPLTSDDWPFLKQYTYAMGAHCPDVWDEAQQRWVAKCNPDYSGFSIQISEAASLLRWYLDSMTQSWWLYRKPYQINSIKWNIPASCGAANVFIENKATAALYTYTPYQPNQAALNNMYGTGDGCSAYGNRNFWRTYNDWFGATRRGLVSTVDGGVYLVENGLKRPFPSAEAFYSNYYNWVNPVPISSAELALIPDGAAMPYNNHFRDGQLIISPSYGVFLVENGLKRPFPSAAIFLSHSYKWSDLVPISSAELSLVPDGAAMQ